MANSDLRQFLQDILTRYEPGIDLSEGSRADSELIQPIVQRIGIDPFDENISAFITTRVQQAFPELSITEADDLSDTLINPMRVLIEPLVREVKLVKVRSNLRNSASMAEEEVDALLGNFFEARSAGGYAVGVVRIYFATPQTVSLTLTNPGTTRSGLRFRPSRPQSITADQMLLNREGSEYYFDVNYTAEERGDSYNVEPGDIVSVANLPTATRVKNIRRFRDGVERETSADFQARVQSGIGDKTLTVARGISATLTNSFPAIRRLFSVGFRDPEMQRDVIKGGSLGPIPESDLSGQFFGTGTAVDDLDGDLTTPIINAPGGNFVSRLGAAGSTPRGWFVTVTYANGDLVMVDAEIVSIISSTQVRLGVELPVTTPDLSIVWCLRQKTLTISDIPGGIALPDTAEGTLELSPDSVHIGGKTDVYIAGETEAAVAQITRLTDEAPSARGTNAQTQGLTGGSEDVVLINDPGGIIVVGSSLVLEEGADAGSYRILAITGSSPLNLKIDTLLTGSQGSLSWKVVDEIDVELTDPKDVKLSGSDMVTAAGSTVVTTESSASFLDAAVAEGDILELFDEDFGGEFTVTEVGAVSMRVTPPITRTFPSVAYRVFRRSEAVRTPVVRVSALELLDSTGAPSGTKIPYRDPLLALSNAFQNEGSGFAFEGLCRVGLVSSGVGVGGGVFRVGGSSINWEVYDKDAYWGDPVNTGTFTFTLGLKSAAQVASEINADFVLNLMGVKARVITYLSWEYVGIVSPSLVVFESGTAIAQLGMTPGARNSQIVSFDENSRFTDFGVRLGDVIEVMSGTSVGQVGRVISGPVVDLSYDSLLVGSGPIGPEDLNGVPGLFNNVVFNPDVAATVRIGRASVGSARVYFSSPTSAEFDYRTTRFAASTPIAQLNYRPDPENLRVVRPPPPTTELPNTGITTPGSPGTLTDASADFLLYGIKAGDLVDVLYVPIDGTSTLPASGNIAFTASNNNLRVRIGTDPFILITFPFPMIRQDAVDFINERVGMVLASLAPSGALRLRASVDVELDPTSSAITHVSNPLFLDGAQRNNTHPNRGIYIVRTVSTNTISLSERTSSALAGAVIENTQYRIRRYVQRISATEMNSNLEASGLYFADVELISGSPGDVNNIQSGVTLDATNVRADGYRLITDSQVTSFSRAEILRAQISRSMLLVGSADDPAEAVQLSQQNVQVSYDRSQLVDEVQSFVDSNFQRVLCEEILVRHLLPHYVSLTWFYAGGGSEPDMIRAINAMLDSIEPDEPLEVLDLTGILKKNSATSVFTPDPSVATGRTAPLFLVVYHDDQRRIRAMIVKDFVTSVRVQRYLPDVIKLKRISAGGVYR